MGRRIVTGRGMSFTGKIITAAAVLGLFAAPAQAVIGVSGNVEAGNETGYHEGDVYRNFLKADVNLDENFGNTVVKVTLRAEDDSIRPETEDSDNAVNTYNKIDGLRDDNTDPQRIYLREAYISQDFYFESFIDSINFKIGRIIYTWGNSDEVKPVDIINPQDYSNFYVTLIQERKIGVLSGSASIYFTDNFFIEGVAIPEFRQSEIASDVFVTSEIRQLEYLMANGIYTGMTTLTFSTPVVESPDDKISKSSYAGRIGLTLFDIDMHVSYYNGYDHLPVTEMTLSGTNVDVDLDYKRIQMFGFDFQRALFAGISLRGEAAYYDRGKYFNYDSSGNILTSPLLSDVSAGGNGSVEKDYAEYTVGFDDHDFIFDDLYVNLQFHQEIIRDYEDTLSDNQYTNLVLWNVKYFMFNRKFCISSRGAYNTGNKSVYGNGELMVKPADNFEFMAGVWVFEGDEDTDFGQFDAEDMVYLSGRLVF